LEVGRAQSGTAEQLVVWSPEEEIQRGKIKFNGEMGDPAAQRKNLEVLTAEQKSWQVPGFNLKELEGRSEGGIVAKG
jgi:hypothetical protein